VHLILLILLLLTSLPSQYCLYLGQPERHLHSTVQADGKGRAGLAQHVGRHVILEVAHEPHGVRVLGITCGLTLVRVFIPIRPRFLTPTYRD